jgi:hypothetical protein
MITHIIHWHSESNYARLQEFTECLYKTLESKVDKVVILNQFDLPPHLFPKIRIINIDKRPTFNDFIKVANQYEGVVIFGNTDIYPTNEALEYCKDIRNGDCYALSRHDIIDGKPVLFNRKDSQDTWVFRTPISNIEADFYLGVPGCDNRFAYECEKAGYKIFNPSKDLVFIHVHKSNIRTYTKADTVEPPYLTLTPCKISDRPQ